MFVKVRKVGNSYTVTIPAPAIDALKIYDGQELEVKTSYHTLEYIIPKTTPNIVDWGKYQTTKTGSKKDARDGLTPEEYVRRMRDNDR